MWSWFVREDSDQFGCGCLRRVELFVGMQQSSKLFQSSRLFPYVTKLLIKFQRFFHILYSIL